MILAERTVAPYRYRRGGGALIVSFPHVGTFIPRSVGRALNECAARRPDTDWHLPRLYDFVRELDATTLVATHSRYFVDLNRPPDGANLYPGQDTPRLCPIDTFRSEPLYREGEPSEAEIARRLEAVWHPYHRRLQREIERVLAEHGRAILWDAHSIAAEVPRLFEGRLPDLNLGTADGASCDPRLGEALAKAARRQEAYTSVLNGRFKGGYITRRYGDPQRNVHAVQLELVCDTYMQESSPYTFLRGKAERVQAVLRELVTLAAGHSAPASTAAPAVR